MRRTKKTEAHHLGFPRRMKYVGAEGKDSVFAYERVKGSSQGAEHIANPPGSKLKTLLTEKQIEAAVAVTSAAQKSEKERKEAAVKARAERRAKRVENKAP